MKTALVFLLPLIAAAQITTFPPNSGAISNTTLFANTLLGVKPPVSVAVPTITLTQSATTGITNGTSYPTVVSGPAVDTTHFLWLSCNPILGAVFGSPNTAVRDNHLNSQNNAGTPIFEFMADSSNVEYYTQGNSQTIRISVDGQQVLQTTPNATSGTAQAGAAGTVTLAAGASGTNGTYNLQYVYITGGTGSGQSKQITAYNGTTKVATVASNWATNPDATSTYEIRATQSPFASPPSNGLQYRILLAFGTRAVRRIRIETANLAIAVVVDQSGTVTKPVNQLPIRAFVIGDSIAEGTGALPFQDWPSLYGEILGWEIWNDGRGGTGFLANDGNLRLNYQDGAVPAVNSWVINTAAVTVAGTMQISQNGLTTASVATNASLGTVQAALDATFGSGAFYLTFWTSGSSYVLIGKGGNATQTAPLTITTSGVTGTVAVSQYLGDIAPYVPKDANGNSQPFVIVVQGSGNDDSFASSTLPAAANLLYSSLKATFPTAMILATGRWMNIGPESGIPLVTNQDLATSAAANLVTINGHSPFVPLFNSSTGVGYLNGSTNIGTPSGVSGVNTDYLVWTDGTHPAYLAGHYNLAMQFAQQTLAILSK